MKPWIYFTLGLLVGAAVMFLAQRTPAKFQLVRMTERWVIKINTATGQTWEQDDKGNWQSIPDVTKSVSGTLSH